MVLFLILQDIKIKKIGDWHGASLGDIKYGGKINPNNANNHLTQKSRKIVVHFQIWIIYITTYSNGVLVLMYNFSMGLLLS